MGLYLNTYLCRAHLCRRTARLKYLLAILRTLPRPARTPVTPSRHTCSCAWPLPPPPPSLTGQALPKLERVKRGGFGWLASSNPRGNMLRGQPKCLLCQHMRAGRAYSSSSSSSGTSSGSYSSSSSGTSSGSYSSSSSGPGSGSSSSSTRGGWKGDAPIGILEESKAALQLGYLGQRLGQSFQYLSKHVNAYFSGPDTPAQATPTLAPYGRAGFESGETGPARRGKRGWNQRLANERAGPEGELDVSANRIEETPPAQAGGGLQLFHISSFTARLGESYSYVARHVNSAFSTAVARETPPPGTVTDEMTPTRVRRRKRRTEVCSGVGGTGGGSDRVQVPEAAGTQRDATPVKPEDPGVWDDVYLHLARRVNSYFGAKEADATWEPTRARDPPGARLRSVATATQAPRPAGSPTGPALGLKGPPPAANQEAEALQQRSPGLFHISSLATSFGESYAQMANHVNRYFKEEEEDGLQQADWQEAGYTSVPPQGRAQSFIRTAISDLLGSYVGGAMGPSTPTASPAGTMRSTQVVGGRRQAEAKTRVLVRKLQQAANPASLNACIEELNKHLIRYPACTVVAWQEKAAALLLSRRRFHGDDQELQGAIRESLALIGYVDSVKGRGIRILSIDGGGTRGVVPLQVLKRLEAGTGRQVHQLFDYICGVSTGAVLAFMLGLVRLSLEECEEMYRRFGSDVFRQNPLVGTVNMGWSHSYYNTSTWEALLREKIGNKVLIKTARDELSPKVSAVSAVVNWGTTPKAFVFRNYNHAPGRLSRYAGASGHQLWQAIRASSAAPGYFQEFPLHSDIHQDGALILNNPCALAVHECRLLWPTRPFQCVLSLGTGRHDNVKKGPVTSTSLRSKISNLISSATDTEGVHTLLDDLLSPDTYFRFNPTLSAGVTMDECRPGALDLLRADTRLYLDRNQPKVERLCRVLGPERGALQLAGDRVRERAWELRHRWA
ncbi:calcium-independent phospholipase A2-gamma-like [Anguilla anguilla]|uniref:calcium-independent phospholipase A2-gamma-like n=1 Tax=Anguilla anguilla TaxID=7936 RepID=UPI0015A85F84|nr:calcium-independent phospholipase A2-gamma-like [Anguilla anguilla]